MFKYFLKLSTGSKYFVTDKQFITSARKVKENYILLYKIYYALDLSCFETSWKLLWNLPVTASCESFARYCLNLCRATPVHIDFAFSCLDSTQTAVNMNYLEDSQPRRFLKKTISWEPHWLSWYLQQQRYWVRKSGVAILNFGSKTAILISS